ncbi:unnamed protein product [Gongylonema pulchrum]|uniref:MFS transporter n=1 Tax=Gongylonema pulchrum TaxID=637853 RepID=A0A183DDS3_9BILA|nr:unnamed protein product [Gongylonema pulchrum]
MGFILFGIWVLLFRNQPADHPLVKQIELERIQRDKSSTSLRAAATRSAKVPYLAILTTPAIWGVWVAATGDLMALQV